MSDEEPGSSHLRVGSYGLGMPSTLLAAAMLGTTFDYVNYMPRAGSRASRSRRMGRHVEPGQPKIGRNEPCPCGSGKKYKKCCIK